MSEFMMASGQMVDIYNFTPDQVHLEDLAHHLSRIQRFNGALPLDISYTVGEHCINMCRYFMQKGSRAFPKYALLHDASEAYLSDLVSPIKGLLPDYKKLENTVQSVIYKKYLGADEVMFPELKETDKRMLMDEVGAMMPENVDKYAQATGLEKLGMTIEYNNHPSTVKQCFLTLCNELGIRE